MDKRKGGMAATAILLAITIGLGSLALLGPAPTATAQGDKPNVIIVLVDDLDETTMDILVASSRMPNFTHLFVDEGLDVENGFVTTSLCCPARATLWTGQYAHNHGVDDNVPPRGGVTVFEDEDTLATRLKAAGYHTAYLGKYFNGYGDLVPREYQPPGWDVWDPYTGRAHYYDHGMTPSTTGVDIDFYATDVLSAKTSATLAQAATGADPFLLVVAPHAPHFQSDHERCKISWRTLGSAVPAPRHEGVFADVTLPSNPAVGESNRSDKAPWLRTLTSDLTAEDHECIDHHRKSGLEAMLAVDELLGDIDQTLLDTGAANDTIILFLSDNGYLWGEHNLVAKRLPYEPAARVPFYVHYNGFRTGADDSCIVTNNDVAPTVLTMAGVPVPAAMDGRDMGAWLRTGSTDACRQATLLEYHPGPGSTPPGFDVVRTDSYKYIRYANGQRELYDLGTDPYELRSLARDSEQAARVEAMDAWLEELTSCAGASCRQAEDAPPARSAEEAGGNPDERPDESTPLGAAVAVAALAGAGAIVRRRQ